MLQVKQQELKLSRINILLRKNEEYQKSMTTTFGGLPKPSRKEKPASFFLRFQVNEQRYVQHPSIAAKQYPLQQQSK